MHMDITLHACVLIMVFGQKEKLYILLDVSSLFVTVSI